MLRVTNTKREKPSTLARSFMHTVAAVDDSPSKEPFNTPHAQRGRCSLSIQDCPGFLAAQAQYASCELHNTTSQHVSELTHAALDSAGPRRTYFCSHRLLESAAIPLSSMSEETYANCLGYDLHRIIQAPLRTLLGHAVGNPLNPRCYSRKN